MRTERCETCRFWDRSVLDTVGFGACRRFPPIHLECEVFDEGGSANVGEWPDTLSEDWCGEWKPTPSPEAHSPAAERS